jgi:hypothetical protein
MRLRHYIWAVLLAAVLITAGCWATWQEDYRGPSARLAPCPPAPGIGGVQDGKVFVPIANVWIDSAGFRHTETVYVVRKDGAK